jgi:hypothetical protein
LSLFCLFWRGVQQYLFSCVCCFSSLLLISFLRQATKKRKKLIASYLIANGSASNQTFSNAYRFHFYQRLTDFYLSLKTNFRFITSLYVIVCLIAAAEERESSLFAKEELEEVGRVARRNRVGLVARVVFEAEF